MPSPQVQLSSKTSSNPQAADSTKGNMGIRLSYGLGWGLYLTPCGEAFFNEDHAGGWQNPLFAFDKQRTGILIMSPGVLHS